MPDDVKSGRPDVSIITSLATGYWASMVLLTANRIGVFSQLADGPLSSPEISKRCAVGDKGGELLLNACVAHGLLIKEEDQYRNSPTAQTFLVRGKPPYLGDALKYSEDLYPVWGGAGSDAAHLPPARPAFNHTGR